MWKNVVCSGLSFFSIANHLASTIQAVAGEFDIPVLQLAATELISGVSGETEDKIRQLFDIAKANAPCVLVSICGKVKLYLSIGFG